MEFDLHTHTTYSDGSLMHMMASAAEEAGLEEIGFSDHANVSQRKAMKQVKYNNGFNLDMTCERRETAIEKLRERKEITIYSAVEMDYDPRDEKNIRKFLDKKNFDYSLGSVHNLENTNVHIRDYFRNKTKKSRRKLVKKYFEKLEKLIQSEMFDIASHIDVFERNPQFQGFADKEDYEQIAEAFKHSKTIPEINAGRALQGLEEIHPTKEFREILIEKGITFTAGTDSHRPEDIGKLNQHLDKKLKELDITVKRPQTLQH
ncbi:hypothetical protein AQV86_03890 [Nanohaloarchaea archaeon SG9]|nr:hypothetical protein AQV86_03890 [Nanohaloarchaea archaeon SG9]